MPLFEWQFKNYDDVGIHQVSNSFNPGAFDLDYTASTDDNTQNLFEVTTDNNFGMQYSGQYSYHNWNSLVVPQEHYNFFLQIFFYTCETRNFVLFSIQEENGASDRTITDMPFLQIGVNAD